MTTLIPRADLGSVRHDWVDADGVRVFYREAGASWAPPLLLLHGAPGSSHQFRNLIPLLARQFRVLAPDLPGFGFSEIAPAGRYDFTFDRLAQTLWAFLDLVGVRRLAVYLVDHGAPVGFRMALLRPDAVRAVISQSGNAYVEGLSEAWAPVRTYWADPCAAHRRMVEQAFLQPQGVAWRYLHGAADPAQVAPEAYTLDTMMLQRPGALDVQLQLLFDYKSNLAFYPRFQAWMRESLPRTLVIWGRHDPWFIPVGAEAFARDVPDAVVELLDAGHCALETHSAYIAQRILSVLASPRG